MRAAYISRTGVPSVIQVGEVPQPVSAEGEVIVRTRAASLNHHDVYVRRGDLRGIPLPLVLGSDGAGEVVDAFCETELHAGDRVVIYPVLYCGQCLNCVGGTPHKCISMKMIGSEVNGTQADFVRVPHQNLLKLPDSVSFEAAACAALSGLTAWNMVHDAGNIRQNERALVFGASGGVGIYVLWFLKHLGVHVTAVTTQDSKIEVLQGMGADDVVLAHSADVLRKSASLSSGGFDVAFNWVGGPTWRYCPAAVRSGGRILTCGAVANSIAEIDLRQIFYRNVSIVGCTMGSPKALAQLLNFLSVHSPPPHMPVDVIDLNGLPEAHDRMENGQVVGKIVVKL